MSVHLPVVQGADSTALRVLSLRQHTHPIILTSYIAEPIQFKSFCVYSNEHIRDLVLLTFQVIQTNVCGSTRIVLAEEYCFVFPVLIIIHFASQSRKYTCPKMLHPRNGSDNNIAPCFLWQLPNRINISNIYKLCYNFF